MLLSMQTRYQTSPSSAPPRPALALALLLAQSLALIGVLMLTGCDQGKPTPPTQKNLGSKLRLDKSFHEFGKVLHGRKPSTSFRLENISKDRLEILGEQNSCSCANIDHEILDAAGKQVERPIYFPPKRMEDGSTLLTWLMPGETLHLTVHVDTAKRDPIAKQESAETHLLFEDDTIGEVVLGYRFFIDPPILADPGPGFRTLPISRGGTGLDSLELYPGIGKKAFKITQIEGADELVKLVPTDAHRVNGHRYQIEIGPFPKKETSWMRSLWFHTDLEGDYKMHVVIGGSIVRDLEFMGPKGHSFGRFDFAKKKESRLRLRYNGRSNKPVFAIQDLKIQTKEGKDVTSSFEATVEHQSGKRWDVVIRYKGGVEGRRFAGNFQLRTDIEGFEKTDIGVIGFRLDKP
jgi:hypothetical protein